MRIAMLIIGMSVAIATPAVAQTPTTRAQTLAGEFSKFKNETRTKKGLTRTKYKEVVSEAWIAQPGAYAGRYETDDPMLLEIEVDANGQVTGSGRDDASFVLRNLVISGGLLTGSKVYRDGRNAPFVAVFLKRSTRDSATEDFFVSFGIGMLADEFRIFAIRR